MYSTKPLGGPGDLSDPRASVMGGGHCVILIVSPAAAPYPAPEATKLRLVGAVPEQDQVDVRVFWGKAGRAKAGEETVPHPLICHTVDTAAVAEILYTTLLGSACRAQLTETFTSLGGDVRSWVALLCGLHDLGKLSPAFQALRADVAVSLLPEMASAEVESLAGRRTLGGRTDTFHGILTAYHFRRLLKDWGASTETALVLAQVLGGHHGSFFADTLIQNGGAAKFDNGGERWAGWAEALVCQTAEAARAA